MALTVLYCPPPPPEPEGRSRGRSGTSRSSGGTRDRGGDRKGSYSFAARSSSSEASDTGGANAYKLV